MSNSARAKERRSKRSRISKRERGQIADQHFGDQQGQAKQEQRRIAEEQPLDNGQLQEPVPGAMERLAEAVKPDTLPMSPARRAFQDV